MKIFKYPLTQLGENILNLPTDARILSTGVDLDERLVVWCLVSPEAPNKLTGLFVAYTGDTVPQDFSKFIGTVTANLVYHVFSR